MIKTPLSTVIGGAFWTPSATIIGSSSKNLTQLIKSLFANNEQGFAYDPNDLSTLYQDAAGTIPVTGAGQPVGLILDKSGRNNRAYQTVSASRPILQRNATTGAYYLEFDGADDFLRTNNIDLTVTDKISLFAGVRKLSDEAAGILAELSPFSTLNNGTFALYAPASNAATKFQYLSRGTASSFVQAISTDFNAPSSAILTGISAIQSDNCMLRVDSKVINTSTTDQGAGNFGNYPLYIGRRAGTSLPFNGHLYSLIGIGRLTTDSETIALEKYIAKNTGVILNV